MTKDGTEEHDRTIGARQLTVAFAQSALYLGPGFSMVGDFGQQRCDYYTRLSGTFQGIEGCFELTLNRKGFARRNAEIVLKKCRRNADCSPFITVDHYCFQGNG